MSLLTYERVSTSSGIRSEKIYRILLFVMATNTKWQIVRSLRLSAAKPLMLRDCLYSRVLDDPKCRSLYRL